MCDWVCAAMSVKNEELSWVHTQLRMWRCERGELHNATKLIVSIEECIALLTSKD